MINKDINQIESLRANWQIEEKFGANCLVIEKQNDYTYCLLWWNDKSLVRTNQEHFENFEEAKAAFDRRLMAEIELGGGERSVEIKKKYRVIHDPCPNLLNDKKNKILIKREQNFNSY
jgi:hypothetical protein